MREYLLNHIEITTVISSALLNRAGTAEASCQKQELWTYIQQENPEVFQAIRKTMLSRLTKHSVLPAANFPMSFIKLPSLFMDLINISIFIRGI